VGGYIIAGAFAAILGGPVSSALITYANGIGGLHGWQWMFIIEGAPTVLLGLFTLWYLPNAAAQPTWLTSDEEQWLGSELRAAGLGMNSGNSLFWRLNASFMAGAADAVSIAVVDTIAQLGGLIGPWLIGVVKKRTGSFSIALLVVAGFLVVAAAIAASMKVA